MTDAPAGRVRAMWTAGRAARTAWLTIPDAHLAELVAASGAVEAVTLDLQHGLFDRSSAVSALRAISAHGVTPLVRLPCLDPALIGVLLDAGTGGVIAPMIESPDEAVTLVRACRYPPVGRRSFGPIRTALRPEDDPVGAAEQVIALAMIETRAALERTEDIASVEGLDGLFIGPGDLGLALGLGPAQDREEPEIHDAFRRVLAACSAAGTRAGVHAASAGYAMRRAADGFGLVTTWADAPVIRASLKAADLTA